MPRTTQANNKTQPHKASVRKFLESVDHAGRAEDARILLDLMAEVTGEKARLWGTSIIGFGEYHYVYESGREGDAMLTGFAPRKANMVVYIMPGFSKYQKLLDKLGKYKTGSSCLYLGRLSGVDLKVLRTIIERSVRDMRKKYH
ncbi:MAG: DUF1801 domain-containing protein [Pseudomonadales bacterium]|nr:DUF1801 domain-containing protein [Pseudomonadales bacterium]